MINNHILSAVHQVLTQAVLSKCTGTVFEREHNFRSFLNEGQPVKHFLKAFIMLFEMGKF